MQKTSLVSTANEVILYSTSMGSIGAFYPFETKEVYIFFIEDVDFFVHLEMFLRQEHNPLGGRDHISFRSAFLPVKVISKNKLLKSILDNFDFLKSVVFNCLF